MKKDFDCVEMKREIQEKVYEETRNLTPAEQVKYFNETADAFWKELEELRKAQRTPKNS